MEIKDQQDLDRFKSNKLAKDRFVHRCKNNGLPENFETRLKNLSNFTAQQILQLNDIFKTSGNFKDEVTDDRSKFRRVATAEPTSFVDRVNQEPSDRSPNI